MPETPAEDASAFLTSRFAGLTVVAQPGERIDAADAVRLGDVIAYDIRGSASQLVRNPQAVRRIPSEVLKVCIPMTGAIAIEQGDSAVTLQPGQLGLYDTGRPYRLHIRGEWRHLVMTAPRSALEVSGRDIAAALRRPWQTDAGPGLALLNFLASAGQFGQPGSQAGSRMGDAAAALLSGVLVSDLGAASAMDADAVRTEITRYIRAHLDEPDLNTDRLAARFHLSRRALQRLFAAADLTVHGVIRSERLAAIARSLCRPDQASLSVGEIARRYGIFDKAWLAKAFRQEFGSPPTHYRRAAMGQPAKS